MGKYEIYKFLKDNMGKWFKIKEIAKEVNISERNVRRAVIALEAENEISGRCRGDYHNWNREFSIK